MICKQKNLVKVLLLAVVVSLFTMTTAFAQEYPTQNNNARYIGISMLNADLSIDDNGKSSCSGNVTLNNSSYSTCLLYTSPSPRDRSVSRMPSSA